MPSTTIAFPPFELDLRAGQLRRDGTPIPLRPKTFAVLRYLAERPGELLTKQALLEAVWKGVVVSEDVVRLSAGEARAALGDERAAPRFIETVPRRGYRFIAKMGAARSDGSSVTYAEPGFDEPPPAHAWIVGREQERAEIGAWLRAALSGQRQIGFITGEAGIGKTTLVEAALRQLERTSGAELRVARGQCVEHYGGGAPYLPLMEAIAELRRGKGAPAIEATLRRHAPGWLLRATGAPSPSEDDAATQAADTHEHTLQMLAASLGALAEQTPLVLVLEDVHWSDYSTLDLLSVLAQRREPARLLVLCTLRPADAIVRGHPVSHVKRELLRKGLCREIQLAGLPEADVARYLALRFPATKLPAELLPLLVERSDGSPFLAVVLVDHLLASGMLVEGEIGLELRGGDALRTAIPEGLSAMIEPRLERLTADEMRVLEGASVAGPEFAAHVVAAVAPAGSELADVEVVEGLCDGLARRQDILRETGEVTWPDGTMSARYAFRHVLYQQVIDHRLAPSLRRRLHQAIGERLEAGYAGRTHEVASALAAHFDSSRDVERAIRYHVEAAAYAGSHLAYQEIRLHLRAALDLLQSQPESPDGLRRELPLLEQLGWTLVALNSWGDRDVSASFTRLRSIAERLDVPSTRRRAMAALRSVHTMRAEYATARAVCEETMALEGQLEDGRATSSAHVDLGSVLIHLGEFESAHHHAERGWALVDASSMSGIAARVLLASTCAHLGLAARSHAMGDEALACAAKLGVPYFSAFAATYAAAPALHLGDLERARRLAGEGLRIASASGLSIFRIKASILLGCCDVQEGHVEQGRATLRDAFAEFVASGERTSTTSWQATLAQAHVACGDVASANEVLDAAFAFVEETGERIVEHELHRLRGEALLVGSPSPEARARATAHFERAIAIAAERKVLLYELRAATSLLRLGGKDARERVARLVARFAAENDCGDARLARALLVEGPVSSERSAGRRGVAAQRRS